MLSIVGALRNVARRQTFTVSASATRSLSNNPFSSFPEPQTVDDLSHMLTEAADEQQSRQLGMTEDGNDSIIDTAPTPLTKPGSFPILTGFQPHKFVQPKHFSRHEYTKGRAYKKRPVLGPDAAMSRFTDVFHQTGVDPLKECLNSSLLSEFVTIMGKIKKRSDTNLTWRNQRRVAKAIRRAKVMGIIPVLSRRPLLDRNTMG